MKPETNENHSSSSNPAQERKPWITPEVEVLPVPDLTQGGANLKKNKGENVDYDS